MGYYLICIDGGECILIQADTVDDAGRKARARFPNAKSLRLKDDHYKLGTPVANETSS
jgi:hypothetical protein